MVTKLEDQLNRIIEGKGRATQLENLIQSYRLYARTEGKSQKTIEITTTSLITFKGFLEAKGFSTDVTAIGTQELRNRLTCLEVLSVSPFC